MLITASLVDLKVPQIWTKAVSHSHGKILARVGSNVGEGVAHLVSERMLDFIQFDDDLAMAKMRPPRLIPGKKLSESRARTHSGETVVAIKIPGGPFRYVEADSVVNHDDLVVASGTESQIERLGELES